jgi:hypothetical protein
MMPEAIQAKRLALKRNSIGQLEKKELSKLTGLDLVEVATAGKWHCTKSFR